MQRRVYVLASAAVLALAFFPASCELNSSKDRAGETDDDGSGASGGSDGGFNPTGPGSGGGTACTDASCIGNTPQGECDVGLAIDSSDAMDGARAIGICQEAEGDKWGVISAEWVKSDGTPLVGGDGGPFGDGSSLDNGKGILAGFGNTVAPREGANMLALSSGSARDPGDASYHDPAGDWKDSLSHGAPAGYPKDSPSCPAGTESGEPYDSAGLRLAIKTPTDAKSFTFEFNFYTYEYPDFICDIFNDFFVAMMTPTPTGLPDGNISFDADGNTISVNAGFLQVCEPCSTGGKTFNCPLGYGDILGTGFDTNTFTLNCDIQGSAATSWLVTTAPIEAPGEEITLHFAIWDSGDGSLDSTTLIDNFRFQLTEGQVGTVPVPE
jgi:hypothetical protein